MTVPDTPNFGSRCPRLHRRLKIVFYDGKSSRVPNTPNEAVFQHAEYRGVTILILQAVSFGDGLTEGSHVLSLGLETTVPETLAAIYLGAAGAEIRHLAEGTQEVLR
mgnify:CR=1 FL=1